MSFVSTPACALLAQLIEQTDESFANGLAGSGPQELSVTFALLGIDSLTVTRAHLAEACAAVSVSGPTCLSALPGQQQRVSAIEQCFTTGCDGPGLLFTDVYATLEGHRLADDRTAISYSASSKRVTGTISYDPNPLARWHYDASQASLLVAAVDFDQNVSASVKGDEIDLSYSGHGEGERDGMSLMYNASLVLPAISSAGRVTVFWSNGDDRPRQGRIEQEGKTVGRFADGSIATALDCAGS